MLESREQFFKSFKRFIEILQNSKRMYEQLPTDQLNDYAIVGTELANCTDGLFDKLTGLGNESYYDAALKAMKILGDIIDKFFTVFDMPPIPEGCRITEQKGATEIGLVLNKLKYDKPFVIHCYTMFSLNELLLQEHRVKTEKGAIIDQSMISYMEPFAKQLRKVPDFLLRALDLDALQGLNEKILRDEITIYRDYYRGVFKKFIDGSKIEKPSKQIEEYHQEIDDLVVSLEGMGCGGEITDSIEDSMLDFSELKKSLHGISSLADYFEGKDGKEDGDPIQRIIFELKAYALFDYLSEADRASVLREKITQLQSMHKEAKTDVLASDFEALNQCVKKENSLYVAMLEKLSHEALIKADVSEARENQKELLARKEYTQWLVEMHQKHYPEESYIEKLKSNADTIIALYANIAQVENIQPGESVINFWSHIVEKAISVADVFGADENVEHVLRLLKSCHPLFSGSEVVKLENYETLIKCLDCSGFKEFKNSLLNFDRLKELQQIIQPKKIGQKGYFTKPTLEQLQEYAKGVGVPDEIDIARTYKEKQQALADCLDKYTAGVLEAIQKRVFKLLNRKVKKYLADYERSKSESGYVHIDESLNRCQTLLGLWEKAYKETEQHIICHDQYKKVESAVKHVDQYLEENTTLLMYLLDVLAWVICVPNAKLPNTVRHIRLGWELKSGLDFLQEHMKKTVDAEKEMSVEDKERFSGIAKEALDEFRYNLRVKAVKTCHFGLFGYGGDSEEGLHKVLDECKLKVTVKVGA